jgi:hypothetical protein
MRAADFYLEKAATMRHGELFLAAQLREQALAAKLAAQALAEPFDGTTVAITHFAPSLASADPRYGLTPGTAGFCNALDDLLPHAQAVAARPPALPLRLREERLPRGGQPAGLCARASRKAFAPTC